MSEIITDLMGVKVSWKSYERDTQTCIEYCGVVRSVFSNHLGNDVGSSIRFLIQHPSGSLSEVNADYCTVIQEPIKE